jgi:cytoskeletal protein RodZ
VVSLNEGESITPAVFGEQLRRTREGAGLTLEDIAAETKVSVAILTGLETGRFQFLPERVFCRSFVAQYARTVGVGEEPLVSAFESAWEDYSQTSGVHTNLEIVADDLGPSIRWRFWAPITAGAAILLVAAVVILRGSGSPGEGLAPDPRRSGVREVVETLANDPVVIPTPRTRRVRTEPAVGPSETTVRMIVEVEAGEECWIHYRDRDGMTGQRLLTDGQSLALELAGPVKLTVGNAGAVQLTVDGTTYRDLGLPGQVIHTEVTLRGLAPHGSGASEG